LKKGVLLFWGRTRDGPELFISQEGDAVSSASTLRKRQGREGRGKNTLEPFISP